MKDMDPIHYCLGIEIKQSANGNIEMFQQKYNVDILGKFGMKKSKPVGTPIDTIHQLSFKTCPKTAAEKSEMKNIPRMRVAASLLSQFNENYGKEQWAAAKRVLRCLKKTTCYGLRFHGNSRALVSYTCYVFKFGNAAISWESRKQRSFTLSSTEAEYVALSEACKHVSVHLKRMVEKITGISKSVILRSVDESALKLARNPVFQARIEDIDIRYHFIREAAERIYVELGYLPTEQMVADILTKGLFKSNHEKCVSEMDFGNLWGESSLQFNNVGEMLEHICQKYFKNMASGETLAERYKREDKEISKAFWEVLDINSRGTILLRFKYYFWRMLDIPATWMKENVVDPLQKDRKMPYYHQRFNRVRTIDECAVDDMVCYEEAQMQFHLDKMVDGYILDILRNRMQRCREYYMNNAEYKCAKCIDDFEQAELNYYIKYGDMGYYGDVLTAYTKQKHRMIWERRHPEIMAARAEAREEHKRQMELGNYDPSFWKRRDPRLYKDYLISIFTPYNYSSFLRFKRDEPSQDPKFYKEREEARQKGEYKEPANPNLIWP
ncbi:Retrovirus-related Pol polyprotein from transposon TNT 1-94 [Trichinella murrelli]|uniref:NADH dehydrogenase [ubiquinone] 1 beta subcomplex subunit 10 n=1 Tax=Trichinella murrelli TaxID=144512 RepID=A0A0V0TFW6_9BILA|nr:Retrovirus-related Pol polyprotein from transposon TNT 1-94 [Trichinella murrelli]